MTILRRRVIRRDPCRDAQNADQTMPSILFPPLLSLDSSPEESSFASPSKSRGVSCNRDAQGHSCQLTEKVHDCCPSSEGRRCSRRSMIEAVPCLNQSHSMPSFEHINLKMSEENIMDEFVAVGLDLTAARDTNDGNIDTAAPAEAEGSITHDVPFPTYIPKLRIRRVSSDMDLKLMPSPLARRGGKEMEYLQKQLKAEALVRRRQQLHNEERSRRRSAQNDDDVDSSEDEDKFSYAPDNFNCRHGRPNNTLMDLAGSPPAILKKYSLRRTVSETLQDSGIPEDANLLFTPMGKPLIDDDDVAKEKNQKEHEHTDHWNKVESSSDTEDVFVLDEDSQDGHTHTEESGWVGGSTGYLTDDDDEDDVELSPSLPQSGTQLQFGDILADMKSDSPPNAYKKITLRPKMKVRTESCDFPPPLGTHNMYEPSDVEVSTNEPILKDDKAARVDPSFVGRGRYASPQKSRFGRLAMQRYTMAASESFDALIHEDKEAINNDEMCRTRLNTADSDSFDRFGSSPSFSESNYTTPDNSFSNRQSVRASKLFSKNQGPELPLTTSPFPEQNYHTPGSSQPRRHRERMGVPSQLPMAPFLGATIEEENAAFMHAEATPEPNFATPQNALARKVDRSATLFSIPQFDELVVPKLGTPAKPQEVGITPSSEEKKESDSEDLQDHNVKGPQ